jgi:DNA modification methylase
MAVDNVPAIVADIFAGSGTTGVVSRRLGRRFIGLDLSFPYLRDQARARLELDRLDAWQDGIRDDRVYDDLPLFSEAGDA